MKSTFIIRWVDLNGFKFYFYSDLEKIDNFKLPTVNKKFRNVYIYNNSIFTVKLNDDFFINNILFENVNLKFQEQFLYNQFVKNPHHNEIELLTIKNKELESKIEELESKNKTLETFKTLEPKRNWFGFYN